MVYVMEKNDLGKKGLAIKKNCDVIADTREITHDQWLEKRKNGVGGSDVAAILGLSSWTSEVELWLDKRGEADEVGEIDKRDNSEVLEWGTILEPVIRKKYAAMHPSEKVFTVPFMLRNKKNPCMLADLDGLVFSNGEWSILEIKTCAAFKAGVWGTDDEPEIPVYYQTQAMHYMTVTGIHRVRFAVLIGGNHYIERTFFYDEEFGETLTGIENAFWHKVKDGIRPEIDGSEASTKYVNRFKGGDEGALVIDDLAEVLEKLGEAIVNVKAAEEEKAKCENIIKEAMGDHNTATCNGIQITWKPQSKKMVDAAKLKKDFPEVYAQCEKISYSRPFKPKF